MRFIKRCVMEDWCALLGRDSDCETRARGRCPLDQGPEGKIEAVDHTRTGQAYDACDGQGRRVYGGAAQIPLGP